jgi:magnesium-protoporphyrin O-methyltransferase
MRLRLLGWLPADLTGLRVLDAGCGTGASAMLLAARGAAVVAVDVAPTLIEVARERTPASLSSGIDSVVGDMLDDSFGEFDYVIAMDSLIHYDRAVVVGALRGLARRCRRGVVMTVVPRTPLLALMHLAGRLFPRGDRAPAIQPLPIQGLCDDLDDALGAGWRVARTERVSVPFYTSQALSLVRTPSA